MPWHNTTNSVTHIFKLVSTNTKNESIISVPPIFSTRKITILSWKLREVGILNFLLDQFEFVPQVPTFKVSMCVHDSWLHQILKLSNLEHVSRKAGHNGDITIQHLFVSFICWLTRPFVDSTACLNTHSKFNIAVAYCSDVAPPPSRNLCNNWFQHP